MKKNILAKNRSIIYVKVLQLDHEWRILKIVNHQLGVFRYFYSFLKNYSKTFTNTTRVSVEIITTYKEYGIMRFLLWKAVFQEMQRTTPRPRNFSMPVDTSYQELSLLFLIFFGQRAIYYLIMGSTTSNAIYNA